MRYTSEAMSPRPPIRLDRSCWPLVLTVFNGDQGEPEVDRYIKAMDTIYDEGKPFMGASLMVRYRPEVVQLKRIADWTRARRDVFARVCVGSAIVAPAPAFRFIFSTLLMMQALPVPYTVVSGPDEASEWITQQTAKDPRVRFDRDVRAFLRAQLEIEQAAK